MQAEEQEVPAASVGRRTDLGLASEVPRHSRPLREEMAELSWLDSVSMCVALVSTTFSFNRILR